MLRFFKLGNFFCVTKIYPRCISQFKVVKSECELQRPHILRDHNKCKIKKTGLVLGVYENENINTTKKFSFTATSQKYNQNTCGKLEDLLQLSGVPKLGQCRVYFDLDPYYAYVAVAGLGSECLITDPTEKIDESKEAIRTAAGIGSKALMEYAPKSIFVESFGHAESAAEGAFLSTWIFQEYKNPIHRKKNAVLQLYDDCDYDGWEVGKLKAESQNLVRYLQEMPPNILNPISFSKTAVDLLSDLDINIDIKTGGWASSHDMAGFRTASKTSTQTPVFVEVSYFGASPKNRPVVLVGKGITFNSGSLDLLSCSEMYTMKADMTGAACVIALIRAAAILQLPINVIGLLPLIELLPTLQAVKFGDTVSSVNGKSVRVKLPSRIGRLLIADSLIYARNHWPKFILDIGTMSPELVTSLGPSTSACYTNSENLFSLLEKSSMYTGDRMWRMPLWSFYSDRIKSYPTVTLQNVANDKKSQTSDCAAFLREFICDSQWIHIDAYNVAYSKGNDTPYLGKGMTGRPTRTLIEFFYQLLQHKQI